MYCKNCGQQIDDNAYVCIHCGVKTDMSAKQKKKDDKMFCVNCGAQINPDAYICPHCGVKTSRDGAHFTGEMEKNIEKKNVLGGLALIFAFLIPVVGVILGIVSIVLSSNGDRYLRKDGIAAIVISIVVVAARVLLFYLMISLGVSALVALMTA